jgi:hypothetical protein
MNGGGNNLDLGQSKDELAKTSFFLIKKATVL